MSFSFVHTNTTTSTGGPWSQRTGDAAGLFAGCPGTRVTQPCLFRTSQRPRPLMASPPTAPDPTPFLDPEQRPNLPIGMSLDLIRIPVVLAVKQRVRPKKPPASPAALAAPAPAGPAPATGASLPDAFTRASVTLVERGVRRTVVVEGSPTLGLPYGDDADVLLALFRLVHDDQQRVLLGQDPQVVDGEFLSPSLSMIANALQMQRGGSQRKHVREALERLANVRIKTSAEFFRDTGDLATRITEGEPGANPIVPQARLDQAAPGRKLAATEKITWLLEYEWRRDYSRTDEGEDWITHLKLNPAWTAHGASGWVAWVELPVFRALGPTAKRLYMHLAARAACDGLVPWAFDAAELVRTCTPVVPSNAQALKYVREAARALQAADVIHDWQEVAAGRAERRFSFHAGPVLALAAHLRGAGSFDPDDVRLQFAVLRFFGVDVAEARRWLAEHPAATRDALCFAIFLRETNPARVRTSWPAMMRDRVLNRRTNAGEVGYDVWAGRRLAAGRAAHVVPAPPVTGTRASDAARRPVQGSSQDQAGTRTSPSAVGLGVGSSPNGVVFAPEGTATGGPFEGNVPPGTPEAVALWREVRAAIDPGQTLLALSCLNALAPIAIEGDTLVVQDANGSGEYALRNLGAQLGAHVASCTSGAVVAVRRLPPTPDGGR